MLTWALAAGLALEWITVPATTRTITDPLSGIPVTVSVSAFALASTETTQAEFEAMTGRNPSRHRGAKLPVEKGQLDQVQQQLEAQVKRIAGGATGGLKLPKF